MNDETSVLLAIETLRSNPEYHAAEVLRRKTVGGSAAMAATSEGSAERSAVLLLIGTWESIAVLMDELMRAKKVDKIFAVTPVCHMYRELEAGVNALRTYFNFAEYAKRFEELSTAHKTWLEKQKKNGKYVSAVCGGLYARFG